MAPTGNHCKNDTSSTYTSYADMLFYVCTLKSDSSACKLSSHRLSLYGEYDICSTLFLYSHKQLLVVVEFENTYVFSRIGIVPIDSSIFYETLSFELIQWAKIILVVEQTVTTDERRKQQIRYSQPMSDNVHRAMVVRWHHSVCDSHSKCQITY